MERIKGFISRHRWKLTTFGIGGVAAYFIKNEFDRRMTDMAESALEDHLKVVRKQNHFESNEKSANTTVESFLPILLEELEDVLGNAKLLKRLKNFEETNPDGSKDLTKKVDLFKKLCSGTIVGVVSGAYLVALLVVTLRVQLNVLGGYLYLSTVPDLASSSTIDAATQRNYLDLVKYLQTTGIKLLVERLHEIVSTVVSENSLEINSPFDRTELNKICREVSERFEESLSSEDGPYSKFILPDTTASDESPRSAPPNITYLVNETRDILESSLFRAAVRGCLTKCLDHVDDGIGVQCSTMTRQTPAAMERPFFLVRMMPLAKREYENLFNPTFGPLQDLLTTNEVKELSVTIYESFSEVEQTEGI